MTQRIDQVIQLEAQAKRILDRLEGVPIPMENFGSRVIQKNHKNTERFIKHYEKTGNKIINGLEKISKIYSELSIKHLYKFARYSTFPFSFIPLYLWNLINKPRGNLLYAHGLHYIYALQGGGKSSLMYHLAEYAFQQRAKGTYVNANIERAYIDKDSGWWVRHHKVFDLKEFFGVRFEGDKKVLEQCKAFNTEYYCNMILDEFLTEMNHRMNNTSEYKEIFIPLMKSFSRSRHQRFECIWITSVLDTTDIQLMSLFRFIHEVEIDLDIDYFQWLKDGMFTRHIKGWHIYSYAYKRNKKRTATEKQLLKKWYLKKEVDMSRFDTLNQSGKFLSLPKDQIRTTKGVI